LCGVKRREENREVLGGVDGRMIYGEREKERRRSEEE